MTFLSPLAAVVAGAIVVPLLVMLYFLKLRRRQMIVSSTLLWKRAIQDMQVNAPFQKLRKNLLLLLQLLLLLALLLALARPMFSAAARSGERLVVIIDHSASMNATDAKPTRLDVAKASALTMIDEFEGQGGVMLVAFAHQARVMQPFTTDKALLRQRLSDIEATDQSSRLEPALRFIERYAAEAAAGGGDTAGGGLNVEVLSDGRIHDTGKLALTGGKLTFRRIGTDPQNNPTDNIAIVSLAARRDFAKPQRVQVFARLANFGPNVVDTNVTLAVDGVVRKVTAITVPPAPPLATQPDGAVVYPPPGEQSVQFELTLTAAALIGVSHDFGDALSADNAAAINIAPPRKLRVLLVSEGNAFLQRVIESVGVETLVTLNAKRYENLDPKSLRRDLSAIRSEGYDVIVFDGYAPPAEALPPVNSLYLGQAPPIAGLERRPTLESDPKTQVFLSWQRDDPLLRYVALDDVLLVEPGRLVVPEDGRVLATAQTGPVMAEVVRDGVRHVTASFNVLKTNWPMQVSFAVFISNALDVLSLQGQGDAGVAYAPGDVAVIPVAADVQDLTYQGPVEMVATAQDGLAVLPMFQRAGLYLQQGGSGSPPWNRLPVNLTDTLESDLRPASQLAVGSVPVAAAGSATLVRQEVWRWFIWAALALLMIEWVIYTRRMYL